MAFGLLLISSFCGSLWGAEQKPAKNRDAGQEALETVLRHEIVSTTDRRDALHEALEKHPDSPALRWQAGFVWVRKTWQPIEEAVQSAADDPRLQEYRDRRARTEHTAAAQLKLADWCRQQKLYDREQAHLRAIMDLTPDDDHTMLLERLGNIQFGNVWLSREQVVQWQALNRRTLTALKHWEGRLEKIADRLDGSRAQHDTAVASLNKLTDSDVIPVIECLLCGRDEACALAAVAVFEKMEGCEATLALARQAAFSNWPAVREEAVKSLHGRKFEDFVPPFISLLVSPITRKPMSQQWQYGSGQFVLASGYVLARETSDQFQVAVMHQLDYRLTTALQGNFVRFAGGFHLEPETGREGSPAVVFNRRRQGLDNGRITADQTYAKERLIEELVTASNERTDELNRRIIGVLADVTGRDPEPDPAIWWKWWGDYTDTQLVGGKRVVTVAEDTEVLGDPTLRLRQRSCFAAGTPVWTESGQVAIEKVKVGDLVLAQNVETGELSLKPVVCTTVRPAKPLLTVTMREESVTATSGHRFWIAGDGWTKARDLKSGQLVHTVRGNASIAAVATGPTAETYNLVVADFHDYFVGRTGYLVQDLPLPQPTNAVVPGLMKQNLTPARR
jgi:hypothetical protein